MKRNYCSILLCTVLLLAPVLLVCQESTMRLQCSAGKPNQISPADYNVLYEQLAYPSTESYVACQDFPDYPEYSCQAADEFQVPDGQIWNLSQITAPGYYYPSGSFTPVIHLFIYLNDPVHMSPGTGFYYLPNAPFVSTPGGSFTITLPEAVSLSPGKYWLSVQPELSGDLSQWFWQKQDSPTINQEFEWRNPGGGFGIGCETWTIASAVPWGQTMSDWNLSFGLYGTSCPYVEVTCPPNMVLSIDHPPIELNGAIPDGGTYSGPGVQSNLFYPMIAGIGIHLITYVYVSECGWVGTCSFTISVAACPTVNAGPDVSINQGESYYNTSASATNYSAVLWTTSGDGFFDDENILNPVYYPGMYDIEAGHVELCLTGMPFPPCLEQTDDCMALTIVMNGHDALINNWPDSPESLCSGEELSIDFSGVGIFYADYFEWMIDPPQAGEWTGNIFNLNTSYLGIVSISCTAYAFPPYNNAVESMTFRVNQLPDLNCPQLEPVCQGSEYIQFPEVENGVYTNNEGIEVTGFDPLLAGNYSFNLTVTDDGPYEWTQIESGGFGTPGNSGAFPTGVVYHGYLYVESGNFITGGEIWRTSDKGITWQMANTGGFGNHSNAVCSPDVVFNDILFAGVYNTEGPAQIWGLVNDASWVQMCEAGFGDPNNVAIWPKTVFNGYLYAGTENYVSGGQVWRSSNGYEWIQVGYNGFGNPENNGCFIGKELDGYLYAGTLNFFTGMEIWRTSDGLVWEPVSDDGFDDPGNIAGSPEIVFENHIYVATFNSETGTEIWRTFNGTAWEQANADGFGSAFTINSTVNTAGNHAIYAGTENSIAGGGIWKSSDGISWEQISANGFGNPQNVSVCANSLSVGTLYCGTYNEPEGGQVWMSDIPSNCRSTCAFTITVTAAPYVFAGSDATMTELPGYYLSEASATNYSSILWTTSGDGDFEDETMLNTVYYPGMMDIANGQADLCITANPVFPCTEVSTDCMTLYIHTGVQSVYYKGLLHTALGDALLTKIGEETLIIDNLGNLGMDGVSVDVADIENLEYWEAETTLDFESLDEGASLNYSSIGNIPESGEMEVSSANYLKQPDGSIYAAVDFTNTGATSVLGQFFYDGVLMHQELIETPNFGYSGTIGGKLTLGGDLTWTKVSLKISVEWTKKTPNLISPNGVAVLANTVYFYTIGSIPGIAYNQFNITATYIPSITFVNAFIIITPTQADFGDCPAPYPTLNANTGASHTNDGVTYLGSQIDIENDGIPDPAALGDDNNNLADEDGVIFPETFRVGGTPEIKVIANAFGYLNAWIDFNRNGSWADAGDQVFANQPLTVGLNVLNVAVPASAKVGNTYSRFRFNTTGGLSFTGSAMNGEVEDYMIAVLPANWGFALTPITHLISVPLNVSLLGFTLTANDAIGVFYANPTPGQTCGGAVIWDGINNQVVIAYGDDPTTTPKDGFVSAEDFVWKVYLTALDQTIDIVPQYNPAFPNFDGKFINNGLSGLLGLTYPTYQTLQIPKNWSGISTYIVPFNPDVTVMFAPIINDLVILYSGVDVYWPGQSVNTIGNWDVSKGYIIKLLNNRQLPVSGTIVSPKTIFFNVGWNLIPVYTQVPAASFLAGLPGFVVAKGIATPEVLWPAVGINTLLILKTSKAYWVYTTQAGSLTFPASDEGMSNDKPATLNLSNPWNDLPISQASHLVALESGSLESFKQGDYIGAFTETGLCAGAIEITDPSQPQVINVFADDPTTAEVDGCAEGALMSYRLWKASTGNTHNLNVTCDTRLDNPEWFITNGLSEITTLKISETGITDPKLSGIRIYPNPSAGFFTIEGSFRTIKITVFDAFGKKIYDDKEIPIPSGIDLSNHPAGIYILRIESDKSISFEKLMIN